MQDVRFLSLGTFVGRDCLREQLSFPVPSEDLVEGASCPICSGEAGSNGVPIRLFASSALYRSLGLEGISHADIAGCQYCLAEKYCSIATDTIAESEKGMKCYACSKRVTTRKSYLFQPTRLILGRASKRQMKYTPSFMVHLCQTCMLSTLNIELTDDGEFEIGGDDFIIDDGIISAREMLYTGDYLLAKNHLVAVDAIVPLDDPRRVEIASLLSEINEILHDT